MTYRCYSNTEYLSGVKNNFSNSTYLLWEEVLKGVSTCLGTIHSICCRGNTKLIHISASTGFQAFVNWDFFAENEYYTPCKSVTFFFQHPVYVFRFSWWLLKTCWTFGVLHQVMVECPVLTSSGGHIQLNHTQSPWRWGQHGPPRCGNIQSLHSAETQKTSIASYCW